MTAAILSHLTATATSPSAAAPNGSPRLPVKWCRSAQSKCWCLSLWPEDRHAAVSVPDKRKGERIILVTTHTSLTKPKFRSHGKKAGATELMVPADVVEVTEIPVLGSGKTDYVEAAKLRIKKLGLG